MLANSHKTTHDVLETLFEGICVSPYSWTSLVVSASGPSSEVETFSSSSESNDSVSSLDGGLSSESEQTLVEHERQGWEASGKWGLSYQFRASKPRTHRAVIFSRSLTLVVGNSLYFSSSSIGKMLASQYGKRAGSSGGGP